MIACQRAAVPCAGNLSDEWLLAAPKGDGYVLVHGVWRSNCNPSGTAWMSTTFSHACSGFSSLRMFSALCSFDTWFWGSCTFTNRRLCCQHASVARAAGMLTTSQVFAHYGCPPVHLVGASCVAGSLEPRGGHGCSCHASSLHREKAPVTHHCAVWPHVAKLADCPRAAYSCCIL